MFFSTRYNLNAIIIHNSFVAGIEKGLKKIHKNSQCLFFAWDLLSFMIEILKRNVIKKIMNITSIMIIIFIWLLQLIFKKKKTEEKTW